MRVARACEVPVLALVESARGFTALASIARTPGILRLVFGHLDFQADIGMQSGVEERELDSIRMAFALASRNANLSAPVDGVTVDLDDLVRLRADAQRSRRFGFGAKLCVHPNQVDAVNEALAPTPAECEWARRVVDAGANAGKGAFRLDAQMVDAPVLLRARRILDQAGPPM
jgi:citrate lyase subunit beta/citryl-CoA lyase